jgi:hypothetical protein
VSSAIAGLLPSFGLGPACHRSPGRRSSRLPPLLYPPPGDRGCRLVRAVLSMGLSRRRRKATRFATREVTRPHTVVVPGTGLILLRGEQRRLKRSEGLRSTLRARIAAPAGPGPLPEARTPRVRPMDGLRGMDAAMTRPGTSEQMARKAGEPGSRSAPVGHVANGGFPLPPAPRK